MSLETIFDICDKEYRRSKSVNGKFYVCNKELNCPYKDNKKAMILLYGQPLMKSVLEERYVCRYKKLIG